MSVATEKSLPLAIGLNFVLPGAGYMYLGRFSVGIGAMVVVSLILIATGAVLLVPLWLWLNVIMAIDLSMLFYKQQAAVQAATLRKCPYCAELIQAEARVCKHCQRDVVPSA